MKTARRYIASEIYRSTIAVTLVLVGLFMFFDMIENLDNLNERFTFGSLLLLQLMQIPTRLYDLLPIALLIGAIIALAGLAQRNELVVLRVSGISSRRLLGMLWMGTIPIMVFALLLSEGVTPYAESKTGQLNLQLLGKSSGARMNSGYWFREPTDNGALRVINISRISSEREVENIRIYNFDAEGKFKELIHAQRGLFQHQELQLTQAKLIRTDFDLETALMDPAAPLTPLSTQTMLDSYTISTSLTQARLLASELQPDRMSIMGLLDYIQYLEDNHLQSNRQVVALWRKGVYPFTLLVMITLAAPISFMQTRKGGAGLKVFGGILIGVVFFMINQLALNLGMLNNLPPWLTALAPNTIALVIASLALYLIERKNRPKRKTHA
ncbi:Lipopolysaccharide export system permease protein LptG [Oligella urethralis]|uniref:Lipopolysaccharide export system permease protein lptG n=1 Tax=Oligella urethralis TaxID=90245 RepID=A0A2X1UKA0_9BURK|nr:MULTISPECIES: LPS export ABC transporter permease LptG [Oligella]OFV45986.1 LPS export ABC transporter permease LptG [Oligella sp. HMSC09E12]WOS36676.1 Lipopolysaccharide export system permease protein LptG [Oligella urethralis]SPY07578.1 Lipopolysaccharide export system permease protein lptG [Oligella urethralis]SUA57321.1 Lipopolysaccharide export system permease protein lptG [Oligella urethralis]